MNYTRDTCFCNCCSSEKTVDILYEYTFPHYEALKNGCLSICLRLVRCSVCKNFFIMIVRNEIDFISGDTNNVVYTIPEKNIVCDIFKGEFEYPNSSNDKEVDDPYYIFAMYRQIISAINSREFWLAFCGIRSVIEQVCCTKYDCKMGDFKGMERKINELSALNDAAKEIIIKVLDATHSSVHRAFSPSKEILLDCLHGLEEFLKQIYLLPLTVDKIKNSALPGKNGKI